MLFSCINWVKGADLRAAGLWTLAALLLGTGFWPLCQWPRRSCYSHAEQGLGSGKAQELSGNCSSLSPSAKGLRAQGALPTTLRGDTQPPGFWGIMKNKTRKLETTDRRSARSAYGACCLARHTTCYPEPFLTREILSPPMHSSIHFI